MLSPLPGVEDNSSEQDKNSYQLELSDRISQISKENIQHTRGEKCYGEQ